LQRRATGSAKFIRSLNRLAAISTECHNTSPVNEIALFNLKVSNQTTIMYNARIILSMFLRVFQEYSNETLHLYDLSIS
jgi:hypothetical protein